MSKLRGSRGTELRFYQNELIIPPDKAKSEEQEQVVNVLIPVSEIRFKPLFKIISL